MPKVCFIGSIHGPNYKMRRKVLKEACILSKNKEFNLDIYSAGSLSKPLKLIRDLIYIFPFIFKLKLKNFNPKNIQSIINEYDISINVTADDQKDGLPMRVFEVIAARKILCTIHQPELDKIEGSISVFKDINGFTNALNNSLSMFKKGISNNKDISYAHIDQRIDEMYKIISENKE